MGQVVQQLPEQLERPLELEVVVHPYQLVEVAFSRQLEVVANYQRQQEEGEVQEDWEVEELQKRALMGQVVQLEVVVYLVVVQQHYLVEVAFLLQLEVEAIYQRQQVEGEVEQDWEVEELQKLAPVVQVVQLVWELHQSVVANLA